MADQSRANAEVLFSIISNLQMLDFAPGVFAGAPDGFTRIPDAFVFFADAKCEYVLANLLMRNRTFWQSKSSVASIAPGDTRNSNAEIQEG